MLTKSPAPRPWTAAFPAAVRASAVLCVTVLMFVVWHWGSKPVQDWHFGDDQEYLTMTTSFIRHGSPDFQPGDDVATLIALPQRWEQSLLRKYSFTGAPASYFKAHDGRFYGFHFFTYPAFVAPVRALLSRRSDAYRAHQYTNLLFFSFALLSLLLLQSDLRLFWTMVPLVFLTPALWFLRYAHTEAFVFSLGIAAISCYLSDRILLAILFNSIAATQYQPLALLSPFLFAEWLWSERPTTRTEWPAFRRKLPRVLLGFLCCSIVLVPSLFYFVKFGTPNLIARQGFANIRLMSLDKFAWMFVDPNGGMLFYIPGLLLMLLAAVVWTLQRARRERQFWGLGLLACALLTMFASTCQLNWNHPTFGVSRYVLYGIAPILLFIGNEVRRRRSAGTGLAVAVTLALSLQLIAHRAYGYFEYQGHDSLHQSSAARYLLSRWPALYSPPHEIFCERTLKKCQIDAATGEPMSQSMPAIWRDEGGAPRKLLAARCDEARVLGAGPWDAEQLAKIHAAFAACRGSGAFYIDF